MWSSERETNWKCQVGFCVFGSQPWQPVPTEAGTREAGEEEWGPPWEEGLACAQGTAPRAQLPGAARLVLHWAADPCCGGGGALSRRLRWVAGLSPRSLLKVQSLCWPLSAEPAQVGSAALAVPGLDSRGRWVHAVPSLGTGPGFSTGAGGERGL